MFSFLKKKEKKQDDLTLYFNPTDKTYFVLLGNKDKKIKVVKTQEDYLLLKICYKTCGRPKKQ